MTKVDVQSADAERDHFRALLRKAAGHPADDASDVDSDWTVAARHAAAETPIAQEDAMPFNRPVDSVVLALPVRAC